MLTNWTTSIIRNRGKFLIAWLLLFIIGGIAASNLSNQLTTSITVPGSESAKAQEILLSKFHENLEGSFTIFFNFKDTDAISVEKYKSAITAAVAEIPTARISQIRAISGVLFASVTTDYSLNEAARWTKELRTSLKKYGLSDAMVTGPPAIKKDVTPILNQDLKTGQIIAVIAAFLLLLLILGISWAVVLPLIFSAAVISLSLTLVYLFSLKYLMVLYVPNLIELIGLGLAIDYSLLIVHRFRAENHNSENSTADNTIVRTMNSAGRTIAVSSLTVSFGLATLLLLPVPFMRSLGIAGLIVPVSALIATITLQPVLLSYFGQYFKTPNSYSGLLANRNYLNNPWAKLARLSIKWPKQIFALSLVFLMALSSGALWLQLTPSALSTLPSQLESAKALDMATSNGGPGMITPAVVMVDLGRPGIARSTEVIAANKILTSKLSKDKEIFIVATDITSTFVDPTEQYLRIFLFGRHSLGAPETHDLVDRLHSKYLNNAGFPVGTKFYVGGPPAQGADLVASIFTAFPWIISLVLLLTYLLLKRAFKSIWLPVKAIALDLISVLVAISAIVFVFRFSFGHSLLETYEIDQIEIWTLIFLIVILFGISMDYEVFLVSKMREAIDRGASNNEAIVEGMASTGGVVTAAALIFIAAVSGLINGHFLGLQQLGIGLAVGVFIDATIIRGLLLPSAMVLLGKYNWKN